MDENELKNNILAHGNIPEHIAIIMDGNGRWAKAKGLTRLKGHAEGIKSVRAVVEASGEIGVKVLTLFTFRSEERRVGKECRSRWSPYH